MSVSCALLATSLHQWARRYVRLTQPARCSPEKRARMRAFFSNGVDKMHIPWVVEALPTLLHVSLFLFFGGLVIFLFNIDHEIYACVIWWIGLFTMVYLLITLLPLIRQDSPYYNSLSIPAWFLYASLQYATFKVLAFTTSNGYGSYRIYERCGDLRGGYRDWISGGVEKIVEETVSKKSSEIDVRILDWTISALGDDDSLEKFFEAIPGFFNSKLAKNLEGDFPVTVLITFWGTLDGFMGRTLSSNLVAESVKSHRINICRDIMSMIPCSDEDVHNNLHSHFDQAPVSIERLQSMARWFSHRRRYVFKIAQLRAANNLARMQERDSRWIALVSEMHGLSRRVLQRHVALGGDNVLLAILIDLSRGAIHSHKLELMAALTQFDIHHTLPELQHDFCTVWNELVREARGGRRPIICIHILRLIRHLYIALHQGTESAPATFSASTDRPSPYMYMLCNIASHRPGSTPRVPVTQPRDFPDAPPHHPTSGGSTSSRQVKQASITVGVPPSPHPTSSQPEATSTLPVHTGPHPTDASPPSAVAAAPQDIPPASSLSHSLEGVAQQDIVTARTEPDISENLSMTSTPAPMSTLTPVSASTLPIPNKSLTSRDAGAASAPNPLPPASSAIGFSIPTSFPPPCVPHFPNSEFLALPSITTTPCPTGNTPLPCLHARGLVNTGRMCFANAVLQLLVHSPPFWDLFREVCDLKEQRGERAPENRGGATPLVDATIRFFEEFMFNEKESPPTQQPPQQSREDEEGKKENKAMDSFEPKYMYDVMKEKSQLKKLLVRSRGIHDGVTLLLICAT